MIRVEALVKTYAGRNVLDGLNLEIVPGEIVAVMGPSGTGKSVLLLHLVGLISPDAGRVMVDGVEVSSLSERELLFFRRRMGYLFQDGALYDFMTVAENVAFPLRESGVGEEEAHEKVVAFLKLVDLAAAADKLPSELSGGMRKRAALARAMITGAKILLCDEPTSGLDPVRSRDISDLIRELSRRQECTTVITTHDVANAFRTADRVVMLKDGRVLASGREPDLRNLNDEYVKSFLN